MRVAQILALVGVAGGLALWTYAKVVELASVQGESFDVSQRARIGQAPAWIDVAKPAGLAAVGLGIAVTVALAIRRRSQT